MTGTRFFKLSGGGNDFIALLDPDDAPGSAAIRALCTRGLSLGADGFFVLERGAEDARMRYWNADGTPGELCLNGTRCAAALAFHLEWAAQRITIQTDAGAVQARLAGDHRVSLELPPPAAPPRPLEVTVSSGTFRGFVTLVGVPHFVLFPEADLAGVAVARIGAELRHASAFQPAGANIDFAHLTAPDEFAIRTFERGVEAETLACGTGVLAVVAAAVAEDRLVIPARARTHGGFHFEVDGALSGKRIAAWSLTGDARIVASGELHSGALVTPV